MLRAAPASLAVTYQNVPEDLRALFELALAGSWLYRCLRFIPAMLFGYLVFLTFNVFLAGDRPPSHVIWPVLVVWLIVSVCRDAERRRVRILAERSTEIARQRITAVLTPGGIEFHPHEEPGRVADLGFTDHVHWDEITQIIGDEQCIYLFYNGRARAIPRRAFADPMASERFLVEMQHWLTHEQA